LANILAAHLSEYLFTTTFLDVVPLYGV